MDLWTSTVNGLNTVPGLAIQAANSGSVSDLTRNEFHYHIVYMSSAVAEMGDRLATIDVGRKVRASVPLFVGIKLGPRL